MNEQTRPDAAAEPLQTLYEGRFLVLHKIARWEYVRRPRSTGACFVIAVTDERELVLVEQYRYPVGARCIELPAGIIGDSDAFENETPEASALRELEEETGFRARSAKIAMTAPTAPGMTSELSHFVRVRELSRVHSGGGVDGEDITVHVVPLNGIDDWLAGRRAAGLSVDARILAALHLIARDP